MNIPYLDLTRQYEALKGPLEDRMQKVLASGQYVLGPEVQECEEALAQLTAVFAGDDSGAIKSTCYEILGTLRFETRRANGEQYFAGLFCRCQEASCSFGRLLNPLIFRQFNVLCSSLLLTAISRSKVGWW